MLEAAGGGATAHISSISGFGASTLTPPYAAIKAALMQYTQTQALVLAARNIRVQCQDSNLSVFSLTAESVWQFFQK